MPVIELEDGSLASSASLPGGAHIDPCGRAVKARQFVSVAAPRCIDADALTKIVMARGACGARVLAACGACAVVHDAAYGWREIRGHA